MKNILITIIALLHITYSIGINVHSHYCMGKLVKYELFSNSSSTCSICGMKQEAANPSKKGCCKDEQKLVKLQKDQKTTDKVSIAKINFSSADFLAFFETKNTIPLVSKRIVSHYYTHHYRDSKIPVYLSNCVFRI